MTKTFMPFYGFALALQMLLLTSIKAVPNTAKYTKQKPLAFIENKGQIRDQNRIQRSDIDFALSAGNGLNIFVGDGAIHYQFSKSKTSAPIKQDPQSKISDPMPASFDMYRMDVELVGANRNAVVITSQKQDYYENYFTDWSGESGVTAHAYNRITYKDIYPNIDWILYTNNGQLKHEFVVRAGGLVSDIKLKYGGARSIKLNSDGSLEALTPQGAITEQAPKTYQKGGKVVASSFKIQNDILSYEVGVYTGELVIDPTLLWATYYGGTGFEEILSITSDGSGNVYFIGATSSASGIATSGAHSTTFMSAYDGMLAKLSSTGVRLWGTYYGGGNNDLGNGIAIGPTGNIYICGTTKSTTGIATAGSFQTSLINILNGDSYLGKFSSDGFRLWGTYYRGGCAYSVATDATDNVFMGGGCSYDLAFSTTGSYSDGGGVGGGFDGYLVKFNGSGTRQWGTLYGGLSGDTVRSVCSDALGNVYIAGHTSSTNAIASSGAYQASRGGITDMYIAKFDNAGVRQWGTYYGGTSDEVNYSIACDNSGSVFVTGVTFSSGMASSGAHQTTFGGTYDALLAKFDNSGFRLWATYYGGSAQDVPWDVSTDGAGNVYIVGETQSTTGIATGDGYSTSLSGVDDAFIAKFDGGGMRIWATYYGGSGTTDLGTTVIADGFGNVYMGGVTNSSASIATTGVHSSSLGGGIDGMIAKFNLCTPPVVAPITGPMFVCPGNTITLANATIGGAWSTSDPSIATISSGGVVTGVSTGNVIISYTVVSGGCAGYAKAKVIVGNPIITTMAGIGTSGYAGDGGPASAASLFRPHGVVVDGSGNTIVCDAFNNVIRKISPAGIITTIAGTGTAGFSGDGGPATLAQLSNPYTVALDGVGNIYISDNQNHVIRKVNTAGIITVVAGTVGVSGFLGDGGPATAARLNLPAGMTFDASGNLYIADAQNSRVRRVTPLGVISTIAGNGTTTYSGEGVLATATGLNQPNYLTFDLKGNLIITVNGHHRIRALDLNSGIINTIAGSGVAGNTGDGGTATTARINFPGGVAFDESGNMYIADYANHKVRVVNTSGIINTFAGSGTGGYLGDNGLATVARLNNPVDINFDSYGNMQIADYNNHVIRKISPVAPVLPVTITGPSTICQGIPTLYTNSTLGGTWSSSNTAIVNVGNTTGYAIGVAAGTATLTYTINYTCGTYYVTAPITVNAFNAGTISGPTNVCVGGSISLTDATPGGTWSSLDPTIASVTSGGLVSGVSAGATAISYTITNGCGTIAATAWITVGNPIITTIAGGGAGGDGPATAALLQLPTHVFRDAASGDIYVPEFNAHKVRKITTSGIISTIAGIGISSSTGDGGAATAASTNGPAGVYRDAVTGNIYIAEQNGHRVRMINSSGVISTIVGNGSATSLGDGGPATAATVNRPVGLTMDAAGNLYICEWGGGNIRKIDPTGIITRIAGGGPSVLDNVPATATAMNGPYHICLDGIGNLFVACQNNNIVRKIDLTTGIINTVAGTGTAGFTGDNGPATLARLTQCNGVYADRYSIYIGDASNNRVRKVDRTSGIITTIAGNGTATFAGDGGAPATASLRTPSSISLDNTGNIYIADAQNARIRKITMVPQGTLSAVTGTTPLCQGASTFFTVSSTGGTWSSSDPSIASVSSTSGYVTGVSSGVATISYSVTYTCGIVSSTFPVTINPFSAGDISGSSVICVGNTVAYTDATSGGTWSSSNPAIAIVDASGNVTGVSTGNVTISYTITNSCGTTSAKKQLMVGTPNITTIAGNGTAGYTGDGGAATAAQLFRANGISIDLSGNLYIAERTNNIIRKVNTIGVISTLAGSGLSGFSGDGGPATMAALNSPGDIVLDGAGNVYFTDAQNHRVRKINTSGIITTVVGTGVAGFSGDGGPASAAQLNRPEGIAFDASGNMYISEVLNNRVRKVSPSGIITTFAGTGTGAYNGDGILATSANIGSPNLIAVHPSGDLLIADVGNVRIRSVNSAGVISTIAGNYITGSSGDGGPATAASLNQALGVAVDGAGNIYIADYGNNRIRMVNTSGIISAYAGTGVSGYSGDNGSPATARFTNPVDLAFDQNGNLLISEYGNFVVRKIAPLPSNIASITGIFTTCAGSATTLANTTPGGTWSSSNTTVATVGSATGVVSGVTTGTTDISYTVTFGCGSVSAIQTVTVNTIPSIPNPITGITSICSGATTTLSTTTAGGVWSSVTPAVATIGSSSGVVTGATAGTTTISYTISNSCGSSAATAIVTVNAAAGALLGTPNVCVGSTTTLSGSPSGGTWASANTAIATVGTSGIVSGVTAGITNITYTTSGGCNAAITMTVNPLPGPISGTLTVCPGSTTALAAPGGSAWSSSNSTIASVGSSSGIVVGVAPGTAVITVTSSAGCNATTIVTISAVPAAINPAGAVDMCEGASVTLSDPTPGGVWSSAAISVATVGSTGIVTGVAAGTTMISYTNAFGCSATKDITVNITPSAISPSGTTVCPGATVTLSNSVSGGSWTSSATGTASVAGGVVTGIATGIATITYSIGTCLSTATVTVTILPSVGAITGSPTICTATPVTFTNGTPGGAWSSSNAAVAVVGSSGIVTGLSGGTAVISYSVTNSCGTAVATFPITVSATASAGTIVGLAAICAGTYTTLTNATPGGIWSVTNSNASITGTGILTGIIPGVDTVLYTVSNACGTAVAQHRVTIGVYLTAGTISGPSSVCAGSSIMLTDAVAGGAWSSSSSAATVAGGLITGISAGTATISYTVTASCGSATATHLINVIPLPDAGTISGPAILCAGISSIYTTTGTGGIWNVTNSTASITSGGFVTTLSPGIDTILYTVTNVCGTDQSSTTVTIGPAISAGSITGPGFVCEGATITLSDATPGGIWSTSNSNATVTSSGDVTGVAAGSVDISYTVSSACGSVSAISHLAVLPAPNAGSISGPSVVCIGATIMLSDPVVGGVWSTSNSNATVSGGVVSGITLGTVNISYTVTTACGSASAIHAVTVSAIPVVSAITGPSNVCVGAIISISDATPGGVWSADNANATISSTGDVIGVIAGTDMMTYTVTTACGSAFATSLITIDPLPDAGTISGSSDVCVGSTITLTDAFLGGIWIASNSNATVTGGIVTGVSAGLVDISYTVTNICGTATAVHSITVNDIPDAGSITGSLSVCTGSSITLTDAAPGGIWSASNSNASVSGGLVTGVTAGVVTISYSVINPCGTAVATVEVTVNAASAISPITGASSVCRGSTITLSNATAGGVWSASNSNATVSGGIVTGVTIGTVVISYSATTACGSATATKTITISQPPVVGSITGASAVCAGQNIALSTGVFGGVWSSSNSAIASVDGTGVVAGISAGSAIISYVVTNSCGSRVATKLIAVIPAADCNRVIVDNVGQDNLRIYPNPTNGTFVLKGTLFSGSDEEVNLEITNMLGQVMYTGNTIARSGIVDERIILSGAIANGMYMLNVRTNSGSHVFNFVVQQ